MYFGFRRWGSTHYGIQNQYKAMHFRSHMWDVTLKNEKLFLGGVVRATFMGTGFMVKAVIITGYIIN